MLNMISTKPQVGILSIILSPIIFVIEVKAGFTCGYIHPNPSTNLDQFVCLENLSLIPWLGKEVCIAMHNISVYFIPVSYRE